MPPFCSMIKEINTIRKVVGMNELTKLNRDDMKPEDIKRQKILWSKGRYKMCFGIFQVGYL